MKKTICLLLTFTMIFTFLLPTYAIADDGTTAKAMRFRADGSFSILQITDLHKNPTDTYDDVNNVLLRRLAQTQNPDLVVITGDIAMNGTLEQIKDNIREIMTAFGDYDIPVAVVFGNHDSQTGLINREDLMAVYNSHPNSISVDEGDLLPGCGTYTVPILASDSEDMAFNLWMIDSGDYDGEGNYGFVMPEQIDWYVNKSNLLKEQNNGVPLPSLMFQHIIVPEIYDALLEVDHWVPYAVKHIFDKDRYFILNPENTKAGRLSEYPCPPYYNTGQFEAIVGQGDVMAMFFGHDHSNTFNVTHRGVDLVATPKANFQGTYGIDYGARLITLNEADTGTYETHLVPFSSLYTFKDLSLSALLASGTKLNSVEFKATFLVAFCAQLYRIEYFLTTTLLEILFGTKFNY
ncbi:MAG TPA: metallophosphoesterase [Clostridia bacterium]|nr:metallophosphoesterase [Clostridia bacterium]